MPNVARVLSKETCELTGGMNNCYTENGGVTGGAVYDDTPDANSQGVDVLNCDSVGLSVDGTTAAANKLKTKVSDFTMTANSQRTAQSCPSTAPSCSLHLHPPKFLHMRFLAQ
jgi:hypothetical protein